MDETLRKKQATHFDSNSNQYTPDLIVNPPKHTIAEISRLFSKITQPHDIPIVDFGAGSGRLTIPLLQQGYKVHAIDISTKSLESLGQTCRDLGLGERLSTFTDIPKGQKYRTIVGADVLHHVNIPETIQTLKKHLNQSGTLLFSEPGGLNPFWSIYLRYFYNWEIEKGITECTIEKLRKAFSESGAKEVYIEGVGLLPRSFFSFSTTAVKVTDWIGNLPILRGIAYRYLIEAHL